MTRLDKDLAESLSHAKELTEEFKLNLPKKIEAASLSLKSKLPFKAVSLREVLIHRLTELSEVACDLYERKKIVSAFIITRSVMETAAMLYWLYSKVKKAVDSQDIGDINDFLNRALLGWRDTKMPAQAYNILTAVDEIDKIFNGYRSLYDSLSEFAHPNWSGVHGAYAKINTKEYSVDLGSEVTELPVAIGLPPLEGSLEVFKHYYNELSTLFPSFIQVCDDEINKASS